MLLRRLTIHVKDQNWFAVALDFVIVVAGILIAFQITSMADKSAEKSKFDRQMRALEIEMIENLERYETTRDSIETQLSDITSLREILADPTIVATDSEINSLLNQSVHVIGVYSKRSSLDAALSSELFADLDEPNLIDELAAMDTQVERQLSPSMSMALDEMTRVSLTHEEFSAAYQQDTVTQDLLPKGIDGFITARDELAKTLAAIRE